MTFDTDLQTLARSALRCLDLTSLNDSDTPGDVAQLCRRADGPHGRTAAVCVWPRFAAQARRALPDEIAVAAVANFPEGRVDVKGAVEDTRRIVEAGAQEVDVVLPYVALREGDVGGVRAVLDAVREACHALKLKVILETGGLPGPELIAQASELALSAGADFLKTSTGKTPTSATPAAAIAMLACIAAHAPSGAIGDRMPGFKVSGGVRTVQDAGLYMALQRQWLGADAVEPTRFRIGASGLLDHIDAILAGQSLPQAATRASY